MSLKSNLPIIVHSKGKVSTIPANAPLPKELDEGTLDSLKKMSAVSAVANAEDTSDSATARKASQPKS